MFEGMEVYYLGAKHFDHPPMNRVLHLLIEVLVLEFQVSMQHCCPGVIYIHESGILDPGRVGGMIPPPATDGFGRLLAGPTRVSGNNLAHGRF